MIVDALAAIALGIADGFCDIIDGLWSAIDVGPIAEAFRWLSRLDEWIPVAALVSQVSILCAVLVVGMVLKWGQKLIDWVRG